MLHHVTPLRLLAAPAIRPGRLAWLVVLALVLAGCDRHPDAPDEPPRPTRPAGSAKASGAAPVIPSGLARLLGDAGAADAGHGAAEKALAEIRERALHLPARRVAAERLAFAKGRLAQLGDDALVVRAAESGKVGARIPVAGPRSVVGLVDGSLLVAGATGLYRLGPDAKAPDSLPRVTLFPQSLIVADRRDKTAFWVLHTIDPTLYRYELPDDSAMTLLAPSEFVPMEGYDSAAFLALADGSFVYTTKDGFRRFFPHGKQFKYAALDGPGAVWRLLRTHRQDQMWVIWSGGKAELVQLGGELRSVRSLSLEGTGFDVASNDDYLAEVRVEEAPGKPRKWSLVVYDNAGKKRLDVALPDDPAVPPGEDWVRILTRNRSLALAPRKPLVAVGGPDSVALWNIDSGKQLLSPSADR